MYMIQTFDLEKAMIYRRVNLLYKLLDKNIC